MGNVGEKTPQMALQLAELVTQIGNLEERLDTLPSRLEPVLERNDVTSKVSEGKIAPPLPLISPLATELRTAAARLRGMDLRLAQVLDRLEV